MGVGGGGSVYDLCTHVHMEAKEVRWLSCLSYSLETGPLTEPGVRLASPRHPVGWLLHHSTGILGI